ncbi:SAM-dependent methyltransferase [Bradyrhizobium sp. USDA 3686]|uniref:class I SAM-dependent methyltransferase n=2 Tax=Nitrobacteraceae TaxID=41294 RepID=UPI001FF72436|nr:MULTISPECIES: class I SAM-dependent methyltransferase [unclassified Bradyrhizobium]MCK1504382.1 methyltransferase domain-containing protein [Bradyrhizobium sp. 18]MCK1582954.1 methyltransferase domain-containing protein [Bradyrhizobium sp. 168]UPK13863.1 methyltransferase domain-containing protein [Bradyrhizobium sp. 155]UPK17222.1 methyltransferase domain-containing protein [Bradyrhizobium sp. 131]
MGAMPFPIFAKARDSSYWQKHWKEKQHANEFGGYAASTPLKKWFARQVIDLQPKSVLELGCNVGANLREIHALDASVNLYGIELNDRAIQYGTENAVAKDARMIQGSMADAKLLMQQRNITEVDIVFSSAAAMHCDDNIFAAAKDAALSLATKAIVHLEFNAWSPADLHNWRGWRNSFVSDRWIRDYAGEYRGHPRVERIETVGIPLDINFMDNIGRVMISDVTGLIVVHLKKAGSEAA